MTAAPQDFIQGMRQLAAGVTVVTTADAWRRAGLTATAVCSVSAEPPQLLVCINRRAEAHDVVESGGRFAINVLATGQQRLAEVFAGTIGLFGERRFDEATWVTLATGAPVLSPCLAAFDCELAQTMPVGSHTIFLGRVEAVSVQPELTPLVYAEGDYGLIAPLAEPPGAGEPGPAW